MLKLELRGVTHRVLQFSKCSCHTPIIICDQWPYCTLKAVPPPPRSELTSAAVGAFEDGEDYLYSATQVRVRYYLL